MSLDTTPQKVDALRAKGFSDTEIEQLLVVTPPQGAGLFGDKVPEQFNQVVEEQFKRNEKFSALFFGFILIGVISGGIGIIWDVAYAVIPVVIAAFCFVGTVIYHYMKSRKNVLYFIKKDLKG